MAKEMSKTQIDRLGDRLRKGNITEDDLRLLDQYRRSFAEAYDIVIGRIRRELSLEPTGRPAKSTTSISDKLRRESIRLTQIQDIAGCRLIVENIAEQDKVVQSLGSLFEHFNVVDRRQQPSHGYRAVHVITSCRNKPIEIQVRTALQQLWAELSEKLSDVIDPAIKYGGGDAVIQTSLIKLSALVIDLEFMEKVLEENPKGLKEQEIVDFQEKLVSLRQELLELLRYAIEHPEELKGDNDALPN